MRSTPAIRSPTTPTALRARERGIAVTLVAVLLPVFLGVLGLVVDNGALHVERRDLQALADAAALVVAHELRRGNASYDSIVRDAASKRGLATADGVDLQVNRPPSRGFFTGDSNYVEVVVRRDTELFFMRALGRHRTLVEARAVESPVE